MDGRRFDEWAKVLARGTTRRGVLAALGGGLGAALTGTRRRGGAQDPDDATPKAGPVTAYLGCCRCSADPTASACQGADDAIGCGNLCGKGKPYFFDAHSTCGGEVCKPRPGTDYGCCTCLSNRKKGCLNVASKDACLTFCETKDEADIGYQTNRACAVAEAGDRYTCHVKPTSSEQTSCESDEAANRLLVTAVDLPPTPGELGVAGLVRLEGRLTFGADGLPGLTRGQQQAFADAGVLGAYVGAVGTPGAVSLATRRSGSTFLSRAIGGWQDRERVRAQDDVSPVRQRWCTVVFPCESVAVGMYPDYVKWFLDGAKAMAEPPVLGTDEETTGLAEVADAETGQALVRAITVARAGSVLLAGETLAGDEAGVRALHGAGVGGVRSRLDEFVLATGKPRTSDLMAALPAMDQTLGFVFNNSAYIPDVAVTPEGQAFQQQAFGGVTEMLVTGAPFSTGAGDWQASLAVLKFPGRDEAVAFTDRIAQDNVVFANFPAFALEEVSLGGGVTGTLTAFHATDAAGALVANFRGYARVGSWFADAQLFGPVLSEPPSALDNVEEVIPGVKQAVTDALKEQAACIKAGVCPPLAAPLASLFGNASVTVTVDQDDKPPADEEETAQFPNVLSVYAGAEFAARIGDGWLVGSAKKCLTADGCLRGGLPSSDQQPFSASILKGYEFSTLRRGDGDQLAEFTRDHSFVFSDQSAIDPFFTYARTLVPEDAEDETPRLERSDLLFAWRYPVTLDGGVPATTELIGARAGNLGMLFSQTFVADSPSLNAVEERAGRTVDLLGDPDVAEASRLVWPMPYLVGLGIDAEFDVRLTTFKEQYLPREGETDEERRLEEESLDGVVHAARLMQRIARVGPIGFDVGVRAWQMKDAAAAETFVAGASSRFGGIYGGFTVRDEAAFAGLGDQSAGYLAWGTTASGQLWAGATGLVRRDTWVGGFGVSFLTDQVTPELEAAVQDGSFLVDPALTGLTYHVRLRDGEETERGFRIDFTYPVDDAPETPPAMLGDGKVVPWLSMGSLVQPDDDATDARFYQAMRCVRPGALPGLSRAEARASRDLGALEGLDLKLEIPGEPPSLVTGFARFENQQRAWNAFDWYRNVEYPGLVRRDATEPFAGYAYDLSLVPNLKLGTLEADDWTRLTFPYGNLGVAVFGRGDDAMRVQNFGALILDRLEQGEPRGGGLDTTMIQLAGSNVEPYLVIDPLVLDGSWMAQPGEDAAAVQARADENPDHLDWQRTQQQFKVKERTVDHALVDEKRRFATQAAARAWFDDIEARLERTFLGINLIAITEAAPLAKPNGLADAVKAFLIDYRPSPEQVNAGLLIYALRGSVVAAINLRGFSDSAADQAVIDFFAWLFREGGLPLALFGVGIMAKELELLDHLFPEDNGGDDDDDDDDDEEFSPRITVGDADVYR